jgi:hypothetical protein
VGAPANDLCANAATVVAGNTYQFHTCKASTDNVASSCAGVANDIWYRFTPPTSGLLTLDTCGSNFDTVVTLYAGGNCPGANPIEIACNDDRTTPDCAVGVTSHLVASVLGGFPYTVRVGGFASSILDRGDGQLAVTFAPYCPCDWNSSGALSVQDIFDFLGSYFSGNGDFNHSETSSVQDLFDFLACYFAGCS